MKRLTDHQRLLADALADEAPEGFREALLGETLCYARKRRRWRQARRGVAGLVALSLLAVLLRQVVPHHPAAPPVAVAVAAGSCEIVHTQPLPAGAIVTTQPFSPDGLMASAATVVIVETAVAPIRWREISDDELLSLVAPRPVLLVGCGPLCKQLIFVNPEDEKGFPVN